MSPKQRIGLAVSLLVFCAVGTAAEQAKTTSFYKDDSLFSTRPSATASLQTIGRFGPVGMGIELHQPAFVMKIKNIEDDSPAAAAGKLKAGQIIETINAQKLADIDPRFQLAKIITDAEASDGALKFMVKDKAGTRAEEVIVRIPVLGAYSKTWPLNCPKSDRIVRAYGDFLATKATGGTGLDGFQLLFLLSTGEEKDLDTARRWVRQIVADCRKTGSVTKYAWYIGISGTPLAEYYLRTGDQSVLPVLQAYADNARWGQTRGGWAGRGGQAAVTYGGGGGHLNAGGTAVVTFLMLAKECGVNVDERTLQSALTHFYRFAGRGNNPYGDNRPETGFIDNGKNGNLALGMAAAASLTPDGESSLYARARDACAMTSFYSTSFMLHGHTGGGIGEVWRSAAMGLLYSKAPEKYRQFMDNRQWIYELSRRYTGSFGILGGAGYDNETWGGGLALTYTIPRKKLRICGAPKTPYVKEYKLPVRPWGVAADDVFESIEAAADKDGNKQDLSKETLAHDASKPVIEWLAESADVSDDLLRKCAHHQDHEIRKLATRRVMGANSNRLGWKTRVGKVKLDLMVELLKDKDPRVRQAAVDGLIYGLTVDSNDRREGFTIDVNKYFTREIFDLLIGMVKDPAESWWVKDHALRALGFATGDMLAPHVDLILPYLQDKDWWLQNTALAALTPVAADERCYKKVLPAIGEMLRTCEAYNALGPIGGISAKLKEGSPEVQKLAAVTIGHSFETFTGSKVTPAGQDISKAYDSQLGVIARSLAEVPGGLDKLYELGEKRFPGQILPYKELFLSADPDQFGPGLRKALNPIIMSELIPEYVGRNWAYLQKAAAADVQAKFVGGRSEKLDILASLYRKTGVNDYGWHLFGPDLRQAEWSYYTFDPIPAEQVPWDQRTGRYRDVTLPKGMENWFSLDFDPDKAGWKRGQSAFGNWDGKIPEYTGPCKDRRYFTKDDVCYCCTEVKTLWDKEVLLLRGTFSIGPMKEGCRYRLRVNDGDHVGWGGGYAIYINGKLLNEQPEINGRNSGALPKGAFITKEFMKDFQGGKVTIAVKSFLRFNHQFLVKPSTRIQQGKISLHFEEMRLPPMGKDLLIKSATVIPMLSSEWQAKQDPDSTEEVGEEDKFRYDGKFVADPRILGTWKTVARVAKIDEFTPEASTPTEPAPKKAGSKRAAPKKAAKTGRFNITEIAFKDNGRTDDEMWIWSGDTLMDLSRYQAMKMTAKKIGDSEYLFVEAGGFSAKNPAGWKSPLNVMKRQAK